MKTGRRKFDSSFKAKVALEALKERETLQQLALKYELHPNQISQWKQEFIEKSAQVFEKKPLKESNEQSVYELYQKIGKLEMEKQLRSTSLRACLNKKTQLFFAKKADQ
ncbi:transposase [Chryseobacterium balustinum]|uniref:Transposase n=1 Tax=Chryseobacterium balustinum TaxID=246 RepID=A0ABY1LBB5_9FLAO|nr:transposase [Chryseobacterium balustinum]AZB32159.1 transposase [Chryseobacterium balustinum]SKB93571.1 transposase [Chryseobacterium balustinum]